MDINEIKKYLEENKDNEEVTGLIDSLQKPLTRDLVDNWTKEWEGRSWLDRNCDIYSSKAVETARNNAIEKFKKEELPKLQEEYYKSKTGEGLTPEQKQLKELQAQLEEMKAKEQQNILLQENTKKLQEKKLSADLAKYIQSDDDIEFFSNLINQSVDEGVKAKLGDSTYQPPTDGGIENSLNSQIADAMGIK